MTQLIALGLSLVVVSLALAQHHVIMYHAPQWSPDGRWILASSTLDGDAELYLISTRDEPMRKLTDNASSDDLAQWIDDGRRILFVSDRRGTNERFVMNADGTVPRRAGADDMPRITTTDRKLEMIEDNGVIVLLDHRTGVRRPLTSGTWAEQGSFSPDGVFIVYEQRSTSDPHRVEQSNIVIARADGSDARIVSAGTDPSWSPDGRQLLFKQWDGGQKQLFVTSARPDGTGLRRLSIGVHPQWSPNGQRIAFMRDDVTGTHIWVMDANGTGQRCLTCGDRSPQGTRRTP